MILSIIYLHGIKGKYGDGKMRIAAIVYSDHVDFIFELCCCPIDENVGKSSCENDCSTVCEVRGIENICLAFKQVYDALQSPSDLIYPPEMIQEIAEFNAKWFC